MASGLPIMTERKQIEKQNEYYLIKMLLMLFKKKESPLAKKGIIILNRKMEMKKVKIILKKIKEK